MNTRVLLVFCSGLLLANLDVFLALFRLSRVDDTASHIVLIPVITAILIYQNRDAIFAAARPQVKWGLAVVAVGVILRIVASLYYQGASSPAGWPTLSAVSVVVMMLGGFLLCCGQAAFRAALFPLAFLVFMIPIPPPVLHVFVQFLKVGSTEVVAALFTLTGTAHYREGFVFSLPRFAIEIADECSGIRSTIALVLTSLLAGYTLLNSGWNRLMLVAAVLPVAILKNGIRIVSLSLLATHVNPEFLTGQLHNDGGFVFFFLSLLILVPVLGVLRRSEVRLTSPS
jgi:exosortase